MTNKSKMTLIISVAVLLLIFCLIKCAGGGSGDPIHVLPQNSAPKSSDEALSSVNVFIEDGGSMDGYVNGQTSFKDGIYDFLSKINNKYRPQLSLNYVNSKVVPQQGTLEQYIRNLTPEAFKNAGGERKTSDIADFLDLVLQHTNNGNVSILVSDFILSPGRVDAAKYQNQQQTKIMNTVVNYKRNHPQFSIVVLQLYSDFDGDFFNKYDHKDAVSGKRPYYMWIIGDRNKVAKVLACGYPESDKPIHVFAALPSSGVLRYVVADKFGKNKNTIENVSGFYNFQLKVDCKPLLLDSAYLTDVKNYEIDDNNYKMDGVKVLKGDPDFTYALALSTQKPRSISGGAPLSVKLNVKKPAWIDEVNDEDGSDIKKKGAMDKTFGIKYILGGVYEAFYPNGDEKLVEYKLKIK
jgi:hypothetical protein